MLAGEPVVTDFKEIKSVDAKVAEVVVEHDPVASFPAIEHIAVSIPLLPDACTCAEVCFTKENVQSSAGVNPPGNVPRFILIEKLLHEVPIGIEA